MMCSDQSARNAHWQHVNSTQNKYFRISNKAPHHSNSLRMESTRAHSSASQCDCTSLIASPTGATQLTASGDEDSNAAAAEEVSALSASLLLPLPDPSIPVLLCCSTTVAALSAQDCNRPLLLAAKPSSPAEEDKAAAAVGIPSPPAPGHAVAATATPSPSIGWETRPSLCSSITASSASKRTCTPARDHSRRPASDPRSETNTGSPSSETSKGRRGRCSRLGLPS